MMYVLQVLSGEEQRVQTTLTRNGYRSYLPQEQRTERSGGVWRQKLRNVIPGYLFVPRPGLLTADDYCRLKHMPGVIRILGNGQQPAPMTPPEERWIEWLCNGGRPLEPSTLEAGMHITVLAGPLKGKETRIVKVYRRQRRVDVALILFGQERRITLSADILQPTKT